MVTVLNNISVGVVCKDATDYNRWVSAQNYNELKKYFPVFTVDQASRKFDEIVVTTTASANPNYVDIYIKLNGAYAKAKKEPKYAS